MFLADFAHGGPSSTTWPVRGRGLCGEPGQNSSECFQFHARCQKCQDYLWAGKWLLFSQDFDCFLIRGQNLTFTSIVDSFTSLRALFRKLSDIWGCSGQVYRLLLFKSRSTHFFLFLKLPCCSREKHVWLRTKHSSEQKRSLGKLRQLFSF